MYCDYLKCCVLKYGHWRSFCCHPMPSWFMQVYQHPSLATPNPFMHYLLTYTQEKRFEKPQACLLLLLGRSWPVMFVAKLYLAVERGVGG